MAKGKTNINGDNNTLNCEELDHSIRQHVEPHIYAFSTPEINHYLKIGDTYRKVGTRIDEWRNYYPQLVYEGSWSAKVDNQNVYFRDYSIHNYLRRLHDQRYRRLENHEVGVGIHYSDEFYHYEEENAADLKKQIEEAIKDINNDYNNPRNGHHVYDFYSASDRLPLNNEVEIARDKNFPLRDEQKAVVEKFKTAVSNGRKNLLMFAIMRFGKSFTAMNCALELSKLREKSLLIVIVSAFADIRNEWRKTVQEHLYFENFDFVTYSQDLEANTINNSLSNNRSIVLFLTLQELNNMPERLKPLFENKVDLLIVDETHFAARGERYSRAISEDDEDNEYVGEAVDIESSTSEAMASTLNGHDTIVLHLSGTPYRILMGHEFSDEDIIASFGYTDLLKAKDRWDEENLENTHGEGHDDVSRPDEESKENPYYGFPTMLRFGFNLNESAKEKLKKYDESCSLNELLMPKSTRKDNEGKYKQFKYERQVLDLFSAIDGSKFHDRNIFGFLNYGKIKENRLCNHIVVVLPYRASCDALYKLLSDKKNKEKLQNISQYHLINIAGFDTPYTDADPVNAIKEEISKYPKTISLTVKRMLTGVTIPEWDTMIYLKNTSSPQEYDQAIYRMQNKNVSIYENTNSEGELKQIKVNNKEQTILVDFDINRLFQLQARSSEAICHVNHQLGADDHSYYQKINEDVEASPIFVINGNENKLVKVNGTDIVEAVRNYNNNKGIIEEASDLPVDLGVINEKELLSFIEKEKGLTPKGGISVPAHTSPDKSDTDDQNSTPESPNGDEMQETNNQHEPENNNDNNSLANQIRSCYAKILFYSFLTDDQGIYSLKQLIEIADPNTGSSGNRRICRNIGLDLNFLKLFHEYLSKNSYGVLMELEGSITDLNKLSHSDLSAEEKIDVAIKKFGKLGDNIVLTPQETCQNMVNLLPDEVFKSIGPQNKVLDIASTAAEFAPTLLKKIKEYHTDEESIVQNSICTIPKNALCYELATKIYKLLDLNTENIATFTAEDLLTLKNGNKVDYDRIASFLKQNKSFNKIKIDDNLIDNGGEEMKFNAVVGNPPYQHTIGRTENQNQGNATYIYHHFQNIADKLGEYTCLIYPFGGWFDNPSAFNGFGNNLLHDCHTISINAYEGTTDRRAWYRTDKQPDPIFGVDANLSAGVSIVLRDLIKKRKNLKYSNRIYCDDTVEIKYNNLDEMCPNPLFIEVCKKLTGPKLKGSIKKGIFGIESNFVEQNEDKVSFNSNDWNNPILLYTNDISGSSGRCKKFYTDKGNIPSGSEYFNEYKVVMTSAYPKKTLITGGSTIENVQRRICEVVEILEPNSAFGRSRLSLFMSTNKNEILNFMKYIKTKFFAGLVLQEPNRASAIGSIIPMQNYSDNSDINWSKSIDDINNQLFKKYHLNSKAERDLIEQNKK